MMLKSKLYRNKYKWPNSVSYKSDMIKRSLCLLVCNYNKINEQLNSLDDTVPWINAFAF